MVIKNFDQLRFQVTVLLNHLYKVDFKAQD